MLGMAFLIVSFGCIFVAFALARVSSFSLPSEAPAVETPGATGPENSLEKRKGMGLRSDATGPVDREAFIARAKSLYGEDELTRKEGLLWIEPEEAQCIITLGQINGAFSGARLDIFEGNNLFTEAVVKKASDLTAYVEMVDKSPVELKGNYYKAVLKE